MRRSALLVALLAVLPAPAARAAGPADPPAAAATADESQLTANPCSGKLSGAVQADFTCTVTSSSAKGLVTFEVKVAGPVKGVKSFPPVVISARAPLEAREYTHRDLAKARASVTSAKGATFSASEKLADQGDLAFQVQSLEMNRGEMLVQATVHAHLVPAQAGAKGEVQLDLQLETGYRAAP